MSAPASRLTNADHLVAAGFALANFLTLYYLSADAPFWRDEAITAFVAGLPSISDMVDALRRDSGAPAFYLLLRGWSSLAGDSDSAMRLLSNLLSSFGLAAMYYAARLLFGRAPAALGAFWFLLNPIAIEAVRQVRMYCVLPALGAVTLCAWARFLVSASWRSAIVASIGCTLLLYFHNIGVIMIALMGASLVMAATISRENYSQARAILIRGTASLGLTSVLYLPWAPILYYQISHDVIPWAVAPSAPRALASVLEFLSTSIILRSPLALFSALLVWLSVTTAMFYHPRLRASKEAQVLALLSAGGVLLAWVASHRGSAFEYRYVSPFLAALGLAVHATLWQLSKTAKLVLAAPALLLAAELFALSGSWDRVRTPSNAKYVVEELLSQASPEDTIVVAWHPGAPVISRYLPASFGRQRMYPEGGRTEIVDWTRQRQLMTDTGHLENFIETLTKQLESGRDVWVIARSQATEELRFDHDHLASEHEVEQKIVRRLLDASQTTDMKRPGPSGLWETFSLFQFQAR